MRLPLVSIITPTYNHAAFIVRCIESVRAQSYHNWELIVVDDQSSDDTLARVESFAEPRIQTLRTGGNGLNGLSSTYNQGLAAAKGDYIAILEGDDYWPPAKLERQVPDFDDPAVILSSGLTSMTDGISEIETVPQVMPQAEMLFNEPVGRAALGMLDTRHLTYTFPVSTVIRKSALDKIGGFQQPPYLPLVDLPTFLRLTLEGKWVFHQEICGYWRRHETSTTKSRLPEILNGAYRLAAEFLESFGDRIPANESEIAALDDQWNSFMAHRYVLAGRYYLAQKKRARARNLFRKSLAFGGPLKRRLKARLGLAGSFGIPVEPFYRALGLLPWQEELHLKSGDAVFDPESAYESRVEPISLTAAWKASKR